MNIKLKISYIFFFLVIGNLLVNGQSTASAKEDEAYRLHENKEYTKAAEIYEELLKTDYKNTYLLSMCGSSYFAQKKYEKAKEKYSLAILYSSPDDKKNKALYYSNLSACYSNLDNNEKAYENAMRAYRLDNSQLWNAASMAQNSHKYEECLSLMDKAAETTTLNIAYKSLYGRCYYNTERYRESVENFRDFFDHYKPDSFFADFDMQQERGVFLQAYINLIASEKDMSRVNRDIKDLQNILNSFDDPYYRNVILWSITENKNICDKYKLSVDACTKIFSTLVNEPSLKEEFWFNYNTVKNYEKAFQLSGKILASGHDREIELYQYLSSLHLFIIDYYKHNEKADEKKLNHLIVLFKDLFEKNKIYSDKEFTDFSDAYAPVMKTFNIFNLYFRNKEQIKAVPYVKMIMENVPNEKARSGIMKILTAGYIDN
ncbi:hypothetical protein [Elizabethkingia anophelis]|uniref:hypothetical protein n=1 Tax=Elizabethkingia anophelis TaxID=1117645 RepID=UPI000B36446B|nr:hypothetical protein [Elizabethkingia anophelis]